MTNNYYGLHNSSQQEYTGVTEEDLIQQAIRNSMSDAENQNTRQVINGNGEVRNQPAELRSSARRTLHEDNDDEEIEEDN